MERKFAAVLTGIALLTGLTACAAKEEAEVLDPTITVETTTSEMGPLSADGTYIGTISAEGTASVIALVSGTVQSVDVTVGQTVEAGQALCSFDDESAQLTLQNARAGVATAQAAVQSAQESYQAAVAAGSLDVLNEQLEMAQTNYDATQKLFEMGAASKLEVDQARQALMSAENGIKATKANLEAAQAGVQQAQAAVSSAQVGVDSAEYQLTLYNLTAPIAGVVEAVNVTVNNFTPSGTAAFVISNAENKTVTFYVTDEVRQTLEKDQPVTVTAGSGGVYRGVVTEIAGVVDAYAGLFQVKAIIDGAQDLPDGLTVELSTTAHRVDSAIIVPCDALYFDEGEPYVYVMENDTAVRTDVALALYTSEQAALSSGLEPGQAVITSWSASLKDGAPVRLAE